LKPRFFSALLFYCVVRSHFAALYDGAVWFTSFWPTD